MALVNGAMGDKMLMLNRAKRAALAAVIGVTLCVTSANSVAQETIIRCGASVGHGYYLEGGSLKAMALDGKRSGRVHRIRWN